MDAQEKVLDIEDFSQTIELLKLIIYGSIWQFELINSMLWKLLLMRFSVAF